MKQYLFLVSTLIAAFFINSCNDSVIDPNGGGDDFAKVIYFNYSTDSNPYGIYKIDVDSKKITLVKLQALLEIAPVNDKLYYSKSKFAGESTTTLYRCNLDGSNEELLREFSRKSIYNYRISPDGKKLATSVKYTSDNVNYREIHISDITGIDDEYIMQAPNDFSIYQEFFTFFPDNQSLQYLEYSALEPGKTIIYKLVKEGSSYSKKIVTSDSIIIDPASLIDNISLDGNYLALKTYADAEFFTNNKIQIFNLKNSTYTTVADASDFVWGAKLSPDGSKVAYWRNAGTFCVANVDGSNEIALTQNNNSLRAINNLTCAWSKDSRHILFSINNNVSSISEVSFGDLNIADLTTGKVEKLVTDITVSQAFFVK